MSGPIEVTGRDGRKHTLNGRDAEAYELIQAISQHRQERYKEILQTEGREGVQRRAAALGNTGRGMAAATGIAHGFTHGFSDDMERSYNSNPDGIVQRLVSPDMAHGPGGNLRELMPDKMATQHMASRASNPVSFTLGQIGGGALAGGLTRGAVAATSRGIGTARQSGLQTRHFDKVQRREPGVRYDQLPSRMTPEELARLQQINRAPERWERLGLPSEKHRAMALDAGHGALAGYGGFDVTHDEGAFDAERFVRGAVGAGAGAALAPIIAGGTGVGVNAVRKVRIDRGGVVVAPGYRAQFREGPDAAMRQSLGQDEFLARQRGAPAELTPTDRMTGNRPMAYQDRRQTPNTQAVIDHSMRTPEVAQSIRRRSADRDPAGQSGVAQRQMIGRVADVPGMGRQAQEMAGEARTRASVGIMHRINDALGKNQSSRVSAPRGQWVDDLFDVVVRGDTPAVQAWGRAVNNLSANEQNRLRSQLLGRVRQVYDNEGPDAALQLVGSRDMRPFLNAIGLDRFAARLPSARDGRAFRELDEMLSGAINSAVRRDGPSSARQAQLAYSNPQDRSLSQLPLIESDARSIAGAALPGGRAPPQRTAPPIDGRRSPPMLQNAPVSWRDVGRRVREESIDPLLRRDADFTRTTTNVAGAAATPAALQIDQGVHYGIEEFKANTLPDLQAWTQSLIDSLKRSNEDTRR
jgi:hypothetical protein